MQHQIHLRTVRRIASLLVVAIVLFAEVGEVAAQRSRTGSRGKTKVERSSSKGKATTGRSSGTRSRGTATRSSSRSSGSSRATQSRGSGSSSRGRVESRSSGNSRATQSRSSGSSSRGRVESRSSGSSRATQSRGSGSSSRGRVESRSSGSSRATQSRGSQGSRATQARGGGTNTARGRVETRRDGGAAGSRASGGRSGDTRSGARVDGSRRANRVDGRNTRGGGRSVLADQYRDGRRVVIPSRRWTYRRPAQHVIRYHTPTYLRRHRPRIHVEIHWPWVLRYERHWRPRYRYRQVVRIETVIQGRRNYADVEVETVYSHRVLNATDEYAELEIDIERLELYHGDRYLGYVDNIPVSLRRVNASVYRNGDVYFDREIFLLGDPYVGFELVSTRAYDGYVLDAYHHTHGYRVGKVDLRRHRVKTQRTSRLFRPSRFEGLVPISLLPSDEGWLWDYGVEAISAAVDDYGWYYGGSGNGNRTTFGDPLRQEDQWEYTTQGGAGISYRRESQLQRVR